MRLLIPAIVLTAAAVPVAYAQTVPAPVTAEPAPYDAAVARGIIGKLADALEANFVIPETGKGYAAALRGKLAAGGYDRFADAGAFATQVTADLAAVHADRHLRLFAPGSAGPRGPRGAPAQPIAHSGWIADGVAYIDFEIFDGSEATLAQLEKFMVDHASAKTLIIDARNHHGGGLAEMDVIFPYLFGTKTPLLTLDTRKAVVETRGDPFGDTPSITPAADAPEGVVRRVHSATPGADTGLRTAKVYLLTSKRTASAAEHMALALKRTHRATIIGETTAGAGNYGDFIPLGDGYRAFVPMGRTFDPDTGSGWEGVGVAPDITVPKDQALDVALERTGVKTNAAVALSTLR